MPYGLKHPNARQLGTSAISRSEPDFQAQGSLDDARRPIWTSNFRFTAFQMLIAKGWLESPALPGYAHNRS
jgi:hypothetical protein